MQEIKTRWGTAVIDRSQVPDDPAENARRKKELYYICVRAIMNLPPDRRAIYDVFVRRKYGKEEK